MAQSIIDIIERYPEAIQKTVNLSFDMTSSTGAKYKRGLIDPAMRRFMPMTRYISARLAFRKVSDVKPTLAFIVGTDGEYPLRKEAVELSLEMVGSIKIARARLLTEEDFDLLREAELHLRANEVEVYNQFVRGFLQEPAYLTQAVVSLCQVLLAQLFSQGMCTYIDPETHLGFELSYINKIPATNRPLPLTGTQLWTDPVNSKPLENLRSHFDAYYKNVNTLPEVLGMPSAAGDAMLNANDTRLKIARMKGFFFEVTPETIGSLPRPTVEDCRTWLSNEVTTAAQGGLTIPQFVVSDSFYYSEDANGNEISVPYFSSDSYYFLNEGIMEGAYVPTATNDYASTLAIITEVISKAPKREKVSIDTRFLASCSDPRYLGWRKVI
jgi:hypothetical protein